MPKTKKNHEKRLEIRISAALIKALDNYARKAKVSRSQAIRDAIDQIIK